MQQVGGAMLSEESLSISIGLHLCNIFKHDKIRATENTRPVIARRNREGATTIEEQHGRVPLRSQTAGSLHSSTLLTAGPPKQSQEHTWPKGG